MEGKSLNRDESYTMWDAQNLNDPSTNCQLRFN